MYNVHVSRESIHAHQTWYIIDEMINGEGVPNGLWMTSIRHRVAGHAQQKQLLWCAFKEYR